ncbi:MAG: glycosyltransferase [Alphaproteobacteria bacterium]|nr:glycosyltransferase [Alphaproteobacteria bacterium]
MGMDAGLKPAPTHGEDVGPSAFVAPAPLRRLAEAAALDDAINRLAVRRPLESARRTLTRRQMIIGGAMLATAALAALWSPAAALWALQTLAAVVFACLILVRLAAAAASLAPRPPPAAPWTGPLPVYTLLCPLFKEATVLPHLVAAIEALDYPIDKLDVKLILEQDDHETIAAARALRLARPFEIVIVPHAAPQTKPKALNYAMAFARGRFVTVFDAEDAPAPGQLKAALAAFAADPRIGCVQAPLMIDNAGDSWIAAQFAAEYAFQFRAMLPFLARLGLPAPLGGTSNHFRAEALAEADLWDPHNVTEDIDLGYRLARSGWRIDVIDPPTWEEAPITFRAWRKQRTRWIKGHMQTWLALMRTPVQAVREMGAPAFLAAQLALFGGVAAAFAHGPLALLIVLNLLLSGAALGPLGAALAIAGYASALYGALVCAALTRDVRVLRAAPTMPLYWPLASIAAAHALYELVVRPHHWAKTEHGLARRRRPVRSETRNARAA